MKTQITIVLAVFFVIGSGIIVMSNRNATTSYSLGQTSAGSETTNPSVPGVVPTPGVSTTGKTPTPAPSTPPKTSGAPSTGGYTIAQVAKHNTSSSCWTAINGNVYDVTSWISQHPGGAQAIISLCGIDGSAAFNGQHGGQRRPEQELAAFKIGALANSAGASGNASSAANPATAQPAASPAPSYRYDD